VGGGDGGSGVSALDGASGVSALSVSKGASGVSALSVSKGGIGISALSVSKGGSGIASVGVADSSVVDVGVGPLDDGGSLPVVDDVLSADGGGDGNVVRPVHVVGDGDVDDLLPDDGDVIRDLDAPLHGEGLVHDIGLGHLRDNGGVHLVGALESGGDGDPEVRDGGLGDVGGVARDKVLASVVELLGDDSGLLVEGGCGEALNVAGGVGGGHGHGGGVGHDHGGGVGQGHGSGMVGQGSGVQTSGSHGNCVLWGGASSGNHGGQNNLKESCQRLIVFPKFPP
jgi:hypothetical protein